MSHEVGKIASATLGHSCFGLCYTPIMVKWRTLSQRLALLLVMTYLIPVQAGASWFCEGRQCGVALLFCCCNDPSGNRDQSCATAGAAKQDQSICPAECRCVVVTSGVDTTTFKSSTPLVIFSADVLVPCSYYQAPVVVPTSPIRSIEGRGPPVRSVVFVPLGLRAPPSV